MVLEGLKAAKLLENVISGAFAPISTNNANLFKFASKMMPKS